MEFGALQCGYCTSGFILTAKALLDECPQPSEQQIRDYLAGTFAAAVVIRRSCKRLRTWRG